MVKSKHSRQCPALWALAFLCLFCDSLLQSVNAGQKEYIWSNLEDFGKDWKHPDGKPNTGKSFDLPSAFREELSALNDNANSEVWVESVTPGQFHYRFFLPPICELTNVRFSVKYYGVADDSASTFYVYPCQAGPTGTEGCHMNLASSVEWSTVEHVMAVENITQDPERSIAIMGVYNSGSNDKEFFMFDEVNLKLEYESDECSVSTEVTSTTTVKTTSSETTTTTTTTTTEQPTTSEATTPEETTTTTPEETTTKTPPTEDPDACDHSCEYTGIDCHNYYSCIDFKVKEYHKCAKEDGLAFNPRLKTCDKIENVESCAPPTSTSTTPPPENCICEYRPFPEDCSKYYFCPDTCQEDLCEVRICPEGLLWSVDADGDGTGHQQCVMSQKAVCESTGPMLEFSCYRKQNGVYRNEKNCQSFWKCVGGVPLLYKCGKGYIFNPDVGICDFPEKAQRYCTEIGIGEQQ